ncbi:unnamed protein product [Cunninghamella blakesleeana]
MLQPTLEPFSSVSFQHKQRTSPLPTHNNEHNPYPLFKSYDINSSSSSSSFHLPELSTSFLNSGRFRRRRFFFMNKRHLLFLGLGLGFLFYCFKTILLVYFAFFRIKLNSVLFDKGYIPCGVIRKEPMLYMQDTDLVEVVWEMNCDMKDMKIVWQPKPSSTHIKKRTKTPWYFVNVEPIVLDNHHALYKAVIGPLGKKRVYNDNDEIIDDVDDMNNSNGNTEITSLEYHYRIETNQQKIIRQYSFKWYYPYQTILDYKNNIVINQQQHYHQKITIGCIADNQFGLRNFLQILRLLKRHRPNYLLHAGDAVQNYPSLRQWQTDFVAPLTYYGLGQQSPMIYAHGNHDHDPSYEYLYTRSTSPFIKNDNENNSDDNNDENSPWHAYTIGPARIIVLDSNLDWHQQDEWLKAELSSDAFQQSPFGIVVVHIPPFLEYWEPVAWFKEGQSEWGKFVRERFVPLFEKYGVDLVISGHQHNYERGQHNHIHYAIIGGAGGDLDFERVHDWGMYDATLLDFHYVMMDFIPPSPSTSNQWNLHWNTYDKKGNVMDTQIILPTEKPFLKSISSSSQSNSYSFDQQVQQNHVSDSDEDQHGAVDADIIQDITLMDLDDDLQ